MIAEQLHHAGVPWLMIEPAKAEYAAMAGRVGGDRVVVIRPGSPDALPVGLNPLEPESGVPIQTHIDLVRALFRSPRIRSSETSTFPVARKASAGPVPLSERVGPTSVRERRSDLVSRSFALPRGSTSRGSGTVLLPALSSTWTHDRSPNALNRLAFRSSAEIHSKVEWLQFCG